MRFGDIPEGSKFMHTGDLYIRIAELNMLHTPLATYNAICLTGNAAGEIYKFVDSADVLPPPTYISEALSNLEQKFGISESLMKEVADGSLFEHMGKVYAKINRHFGVNSVLLSGDDAGSLWALDDDDEVKTDPWRITRGVIDE